MDVNRYNEKVCYLQSGAFPSHLNARRRADFKKGMKGYSLDHCFRLLFSSRRVLHSEEVVKELKLFHEQLDHCNRDEFIHAVRARFSTVGLKDHCRAIVTSCVARLNDLIGFRVKGPMVHSQLRLFGVECYLVWNARSRGYTRGNGASGALWSQRTPHGPLRRGPSRRWGG